MKYFRNPDTVGIDVIQFHPFCDLPSTVIIEDRGMKGWQVYNKLHDRWINIRDGDYIRIDKAPDDVYPIDPEYLDENFYAEGCFPHGGGS